MLGKLIIPSIFFELEAPLAVFSTWDDEDGSPGPQPGPLLNQNNTAGCMSHSSSAQKADHKSVAKRILFFEFGSS